MRHTARLKHAEALPGTRTVFMNPTPSRATLQFDGFSVLTPSTEKCRPTARVGAEEW